ncbi:conjugative transposon protein TraM [Fibrella sp. HMF5335]|uniref:Conjugative transposon protein TraM n=1 Tax=Fibrella rubiginis TaxID=2817060 RepID=A0A939K0T6_9BACT|nr:conjugative transposon protein TraM [Fibrella rubiginis]MBO0936442.1 conjugative transposon protein TraM [Fibrella rubiginis]
MATLTQPSHHKRDVRDLFSDQRFRLALALLALAIAALLIYLVKNRKEEPLEANNLNTTVPSATVDSIPKSKLDVMAQAQAHESMPMAMPGTDTPTSLTSVGTGMQSPSSPVVSPSMALPGMSLPNGGGGGAAPGASVPGSLDRYMYRKSTPSDEDFKTLSDYYEPDGAGTDVATAPRSSARARSVSTRDDDDEVAPVSPAVQYKKAQDLNRLKSLLEEYKRDKEEKATARQEAELKPYKLAQSDVVSGLDGIDRSRNGFYGLFSQESRQEGEARDEAINGTFRAVINQNQTVINGGRVQLRLLEDMTIQDMVIPRGTLVYGVGNFGAERVSVQVSSVQLHNRIYPIKLSVYDMDGLPGIYVPNVIAVQEGRLATAQAVGGINVSTPTGSNIGQAAAASAAQAGVRGVQNLFQRKARLQKASLKGNYYVLLR